MRLVTSDEVATYVDAVQHLAWPFVGREGAEHDDLVQEGLIDVWRTLAKGRTPSHEHIQHRMMDYVRWLAALNRKEGIPYDERLPLDPNYVDPRWDVDA